MSHKYQHMFTTTALAPIWSIRFNTLEKFMTTRKTSRTFNESEETLESAITKD